MEELYKDTPELQVDLNSSPSSIPNKLENGVAQLITAEAWNINPSGLMKKALSPLVTVPAAPVLSTSSDSQSGVALKVAATVLQPICLGESPVVLPIHWQVAGSTPPQVGTSSSSPPYVITTQGPVPLPVLLEQHVFQHLNSPLVLPQGSPCPGTTIQNHLFPGTAATVGQPQILDEKTSPVQETLLPPVFQTPGFSAVLQDFFPSPNNLGTPSPCHISSDYASSNVHSVPPQAFNSPLSPLVPPATLLVPYPVIVPLPVPIPLPIPIPIPVPQTECPENVDHQKTTVEIPKSCKSTQTPMEKEDIKPFESTEKSLLAQFHRHSVIKMNNENEALDLSLKTETLVKSNDVSSINNHAAEEEGVLDLSLPVYKRCVSTSAHNGVSMSYSHMSDSSSPSIGKNIPNTTALNPPLHHELKQKDTRVICTNSSELLRQQKWSSEANRGSYEPKTTNNIELVSSSQTAKVIVSVKDAVPAIFCGKIKGLSGVSTKNFSFKKDLPQDSAVQGYDMKTQAEVKENSDALRKPVKKSVKLKKVNSQEIHILPIKKQRLAAFFPRK